MTETGRTADGTKRGVHLEERVQMWPTPGALDGEKGGPNMSFGAGETPLPTQAVSWPHSPPSPRHPTTSSTGSVSSKPTRSLNPQFVEWLMGLPAAWTDSEPSETAWCLWLRRMHSSLSAMRSRSPSPPPGN